jgi:protein TIF31
MRKSIITDPMANAANDKDDDPELIDEDSMIETCIPIEAKVIQGSDQRKYILDFSRMTPRDANWVSASNGGTGRWEAVQKTNGTTRFVPTSLDDEEWTTHFLRPELITIMIRNEMQKSLEAKRQAIEKNKAQDEGPPDKKNEDDSNNNEEKKKDPPVTLTEEEKKEIMDKLRLNVNVFFPDIRDGDEEQTKEDEERARNVATYLWDDVLPRLTKNIRDRGMQIPSDGKSLTEMIHRSGINCRYLGRLAVLAIEEENRDRKVDRDLKEHRMALLDRLTMPKCWLELLECEIVARAAKHVLDSYLSEHCAVASWSPAQTIASFLSAVVSEREESAAQTEKRLEKDSGTQLDDDDMQTLKQVDVGGDGDAVPMASRSRTEIWQDIELEVARRFRYSLTLFNRSGNVQGRALYVPLLRRICQRCGVRLVAKSYQVGGVCYTSGNSYGGRLTATYPISPLDVVDVVPLMKHGAAYHEGFSLCSFGPANACLPPLEISLIDSRVALERAHIQFRGRALLPALELAQEAATLYQRVTDNPSHPGVIECLEFMVSVFLEVGEASLAAENCLKALSLAVQGNGFDNALVLSFHMTLFQTSLATKNFDKCVKHLRAFIYILGLMGGPNHYELNNAYLKWVSTYKHEDLKGKYDQVALAVYRVLNELDPSDRLMDGLNQHRFAQTLADAGEFKEAVEVEKRAFSHLSKLLGAEHDVVKRSDASLKEYTKQAVEQSKGLKKNEKLKEEEKLAEAVAADLMAAEDDDEKNKKKGNKKKKGKK